MVNISRNELCWRLTARPLLESLARPGPTQTACKHQSWDTSGQTINRIGTLLCPLAERQPKDFLSPQPPLDLLLTWPCSPAGQDLSTHQEAETRSKKTVISEPVELNLQIWVRTSWSLAFGWEEYIAGTHRTSPTESHFQGWET